MQRLASDLKQQCLLTKLVLHFSRNLLVACDRGDLRVTSIKSGYFQMPTLWAFGALPPSVAARSLCLSHRLLGAIFLSILFFCSALAQAQTSLHVLRVTPMGEDVPATQQIVIEFDKSIVPLGRMERDASEVPVEIEPKVDCQWRWLNQSSLACQLSEEKALLPSTKYKVSIEKGLSALDGAKLERSFEQSFISERPQVSDVWFKRWLSPGMPQWYVSFNQTVRLSSLSDHVFFLSANNQRISAQVVKKKHSKGSTFRVSPKQELPLDEKVSLWIEPGIMPTRGSEKSVQNKSVQEFFTFGDFRLLGLQCSDLENKSLFIAPGETYPASESVPSRLCDPLATINLVFSSPLLKDELKKALQITPALGKATEDADIWAGVYSYSRLNEPREVKDGYSISLPYALKAQSLYSIKIDPGRLRDEFGRPLNAASEVQFKTSHRAAKIHLGHEVAVLEKEVETHLPIIVNNLKSFTLNYDLLSSRGIERKLSKTYEPWDVEDIAFPYPIKVRDLLSGASGAISASLSPIARYPSQKVQSSGENRFFAEVTPFSVHAKIGHFNTLVWVTKFSDGSAVEGANVRIELNKLFNLLDSPRLFGQALTDKNGLAILPGRASFDAQDKLVGGWDKNKVSAFVRVEKDDDLALVPLLWDFQVYADDAYAYTRPRYGHMISWGTTAQGLYRAGDTLQFKLYVRNQDNRRLILPPLEKYSLAVYDPTDKVVFEQKDFRLTDFGSFDGLFSIAKTAAVGWYRFELTSNFSSEMLEPLRVLISDFTPAPFKVSNNLSAVLYHDGDSVGVTTSASLHAGGPYSAAPLRTTASVVPENILSKNPLVAGYWFDAYDAHENQQVFQEKSKLNERGVAEQSFKLSANNIYYGKLSVESAVEDDRGKYVAAYSKADYAARDLYVGLRAADWIWQKGKSALIEAAVIDAQLEPVAEAEAKIKVEFLELKASKVKSAGNAYLTQYDKEWVAVHDCTVKQRLALQPGQPKALARIEGNSCSFVPQNPGHYRISAVLADQKGRQHKTQLDKWCAGNSETLWDGGDDNQLKIVPEKTEYKVGDVARFMLQNPFPGAKALITIERFGILQRYVKTLNSNSEFIEVPIKEDFIPGVFLSVLLNSARVAKPLGANQVDLGKPAFRIGYVEIPVPDDAKRLRLNVKTQKEAYKPREQVNVEVEAKTLGGLVVPTELSVSVLDEAVFDLIRAGKNNFDPYRGFYKSNELDVTNFNLIKALVGRQKFEKKGASPGGDGGADLDMRSLFKFVSYWNPALIPDSNGKASFSFEVPDNLTSWRIFVMAANKSDRFGLGEASFKVNKPTEIRAALPNQVLDGDRLAASFNVMNRLEKERNLDVSIKAQGAIERAPGQNEIIYKTSIKAEPYKRYSVNLPLTLKGQGKVHFEVRAGDESDHDALLADLDVRSSFSMENVAAYASTQQDSAEQTISVPGAVRSDAGVIGVLAAPSLLGRLDGVFAYMRDYPYGCWEQKLSKALSAAYYLKLKDYVAKNFEWKEAQTLAAETLNMAASYQAANGGMAFYLAQDEYVSPYLSVYTAFAFNRMRDLGYQPAEAVENKLHAYLVELLKRDMLPAYAGAEMRDNIRAFALEVLAERGKITLDELLRLEEKVPQLNLFAKAQYLMALKHLNANPEKVKAIADNLRNYADKTSGKLTFSESAQDSLYAPMLDSATRSNCAILSAFNNYPEYSPEIPEKLARSVGESLKQAVHWSNTQENFFCLRALQEYSAKFENQSPKMQVKIQLEQEPLAEVRFNSLSNQPVLVEKGLLEQDMGKEKRLHIERLGEGRLYYVTRLSYAPTEGGDKSTNAGIEVRREYSIERSGKWEKLQSPMHVKTGDLLRVDLFVSVPAKRSFVVVNDPLPGGLEAVNRDLATASEVDAAKARETYANDSYFFSHKQWFDFGFYDGGFYHKELRNEAVRFYSEYINSGSYHLSYVAQAIAKGSFTVLPTQAEEMYSPDIYGKSRLETLIVDE